jgi:hypothetical protein
MSNRSHDIALKIGELPFRKLPSAQLVDHSPNAGGIGEIPAG